MPPIAIPRPSPPDQPYCPGIIQATQLVDQYSVPEYPEVQLNLRSSVLSWTSSLENPRQPHSMPDCPSLILANVTQAHLKLWPLQGDGLQTLLGWWPSEGVAANHMSRFLSPPTLLKVERATDRRQIFVVCRHCKSRPPCHTSDHHTQDPATQPKIVKELLCLSYQTNLMLDIIQNAS